MAYTVVFTSDAKKDLKGFDGNVYSRRITQEHRLVYRVYDDVVEVLILSVFGHYR